MKSPRATKRSTPSGQGKRQRTSNLTKRLRVFISYSSKDQSKIDEVVKLLEKLNCDVWMDRQSLRPGDDINNVTFKAIDEADVFLIAISENSLRSLYVQSEISAAIVNKQIADGSKRILPIKFDSASVPSLIAQFYYIDFSFDFQAALEKLAHAIEEISADGQSEDEIAAASQTRHIHEQALRDALRRGRLTLVCGAGVSIAAGVPSWNSLLARLLTKMLEGLSAKHSIKLDSDTTASVQTDLGRSSSLILGKYLKNNLRDEFENEVRNSLYSSINSRSKIIDSIVNLARPQRESKPLDSIITFNFDDLIEEALNNASIQNKTIFSESINHESYQIPIYHVHGYLPRFGDIPEMELVFSEDAYHNQFIDPFSWSNLMQLNKLSQNTCLFVGISLTDPNMRRLLDVAWRKNPGKTKSHFIIKKKPQSRQKLSAGKIAEILEEQDANLLGLNVMWIDEFDDLPDLLNRITELGV